MTEQVDAIRKAIEELPPGEEWRVFCCYEGLPGESWRAIRDYEGLYEVSDLGRVRSLMRNTTSGKVLKPQVTTKGYLRVGLCKDGKVRFKAIHLLVLDAFKGPCPRGCQSRHGPGGQQDNRLVNLSYGTAVQNQFDRIRDGTSNHGERSATAKLTAEIVAQCRRRFAAGETQSALAAEFGVASGAMCNAIRGNTWAGPVLGVLPVPPGLKPSQGTNEFRAKMATAGRKGAAARWHPEAPGGVPVTEPAPSVPGQLRPR